MVWRASRRGFGAARLMMLLVLQGSVLVEGSNGEVRLEATNISHSAQLHASVGTHPHISRSHNIICARDPPPLLHFQARRYVSLSRGRSLLYHDLSVTNVKLSVALLSRVAGLVSHV